jgi:hypothetical protein
MAEKPGRNDPCWCGSGKKYKQCHLNADREAERERRELRTAAEYVMEDLLDFAQDERFAIPFASALTRYWNGFYTIENADEMSENEALRFFDWFAFDYVHDEETPRVADQYREEYWGDLSSLQQEVLAEWLEAGPSGAYVLDGYDGQTLHLYDYVDGNRYEVYYPPGRGEVEIGDIILARILPVQDRLEFSTGAAYLPQDEIANLPEKVAAAREADTKAHPEDFSPTAFLRRHNVMFVHHALEQAEKHGRAPVARLEDE